MSRVTVRHCVALWLPLCLVGSLLFAQRVSGEEYKTPLAGEEFHTDLFGEPIEAPARDRRHVTAVDFGVQWIPKGPSQLELLPFGAFFLWDNQDTRWFRGTFSGVYNELRYNLGSKRLDGWEAVFTFSNFILPVGRSEYVEGQRISDVELQWNDVYAGLGIGYRKSLAPGHQDNGLEIALTYEPGYLWFARGSDTSSRFLIPSDTYEGRAHFRLRADALDRNLMELPHRGYSWGADVIYGHRNHWEPWGGVAFDSPNVQQEKNFMAGSAYAVAATGLPFITSDRHRLVWSVSGGLGKDLDRFSAFRLPGRPTGYEWEALSVPYCRLSRSTNCIRKNMALLICCIAMKRWFSSIPTSVEPMRSWSDHGLAITAQSGIGWMRCPA